MLQGNALRLEPIAADGTAPKSRILDAEAACSIVSTMEEAYRRGPGRVNAKVKGCLDGNPPVEPAKFEELGQDWRANLNYRLLEADSAFAQVPYYSVFSEVPFYCKPVLDLKDTKIKSSWEDIMSAEYTRLMNEWKGFDVQMQLCIANRVNFGFGPLFFPDDVDPRFRAARINEIYIPQDTSLDPAEWEVVAIIELKTVSNLFTAIENKNASDAGWNVANVQEVLSKACNSWAGQTTDWEIWQQRIRHNDIYFSSAVPKIRTAHVFVKEFSGKISHHIIARETSADSGEYLFSYRERFESWNSILHIFNCEIADGFIAGVKGQCIKAFNFRDSQNRLKNAILDAAFVGSQVLVQANSPEAEEALDIVHMGPYARIPSGVTFSQSPLGTVLDKPLMVDRQMEVDLTRNLGAYRQNLTDQRGQAVTATEAEINHSVQQTLSNQQHNLFVSQLDDLYEEQFRRLCLPLRAESSENPYSSAEKMIANFQSRCKDKGVMPEAFRKVIAVRAYRAIGQGSRFFKNQIFEKILQLFPMLPEDVRVRVLRGYISGLTSKEFIDSMWPDTGVEETADDQQSKAQDENGTMMSGLIPLWTPSQDNTAHLKVHIPFMLGLIQGVQQGGVDPAKYLSVAPNALKHIEETIQHVAQAVATPSMYKLFNNIRKSEYQQFYNAFTQLKAATEQIAQQFNAAMQAQQQASAQQSQQPPLTPELALKAQQMQAEIALKTEKTKADLAMRQAKVQQSLALKDAAFAQKIKQTQPTEVSANANVTGTIPNQPAI